MARLLHRIYFDRAMEYGSEDPSDPRENHPRHDRHARLGVLTMSRTTNGRRIYAKKRKSESCNVPHLLHEQIVRLFSVKAVSGLGITRDRECLFDYLIILTMIAFAIAEVFLLIVR